MEKSFGDAYEVDVATGVIRLLTHYAHPGFLRVQFLPNGDYFLIGARTFTDISTTTIARSGDVDPQGRLQAGRPCHGVGAQDLRGRGHLTDGEEDRLVEHARAISRPIPGRRVGDLHGGHRLRNGRPKLTNEKEILRAKGPECTLEAQDFRNNDTELIYTCYRSPFADVSASISTLVRLPSIARCQGEYNEVEGIFPDGKYTLVESSREQLEQNSNFIDIWKLKLEPNSQDFTRVTRWGEYRGYKASNPVVSSDGKRIAFQSARSKDPAGVGYGIFVMDVK